MHILGISAYYHDSAAALVRDPEVLRAALEGHDDAVACDARGILDSDDEKSRARDEQLLNDLEATIKRVRDSWSESAKTTAS